MQLHEHLVEQGIAGQGNPNFFLGENFGWGVTPGKLTQQWKMGPLKMYFLLKMGIFQPSPC